MTHQKIFNKLFKVPRLAIVAVLVLIAGYGCSSSDEPETKTAKAVSLNVQKARQNQSAATNRYSGTVSSDHAVNLSTKIMGQITHLDVGVGDYVKKGDVLVRIKDDNLQAQKNQAEAGLAEARAGLQNAEKNYQRYKNLFKQESVTQSELDNITMKYDMAKAKVQRLEGKLNEINDMLDYSTLRAPFNGHVTAKNMSEGDMASPGRPIISFEQKGALKVELTIPETQIHLINVGDTVSVNVTAANLRNVTGRVSNVSTSGSRGSRQFKVEVRLPDLEKNSSIRSGMFADVGLESEAGSVITVPQSAIVERGQLMGLYTLSSNSTLVLRWVRLGEKMNGSVEVLSGLSTGESFVTSVEGTLREGQKVNPQ